MIFKNQTPLTDDFISIQELRKRNRLKVNYFKDLPMNENKSRQQNANLDLSSQWEKLKTHLVNIAENLIYEPDDIPDGYENPNIESRNLMLAIDTDSEMEYGYINVSRFNSEKGLFLALNSVLTRLEVFLRRVQIGFIMDAETLEFNQVICDKYVEDNLPRPNKVLLHSIREVINISIRNIDKIWPKKVKKYFIKNLGRFIKYFDRTEVLEPEYYPFSDKKDFCCVNDP